MLRAAVPHGLPVPDAAALRTTLKALSGYLQKRVVQPIWIKADKIDEVKDLQQDVRDHFLTLQIKADEAKKLGGGESDLIVADHILIENKVHGTTTNPLEIKRDAVYQANRYTSALCKNVFVTLVAYRPGDEDALLRPQQSFFVRKHTIANTPVAEICLLVPYGQGVPSSATRPKK